MAATPTPRPADAEAADRVAVGAGTALQLARGLASASLQQALDDAAGALASLLAPAPLPQEHPTSLGSEAAPPSAPHPLAVALSGGADSTALLYVACLLAPGRVQAIHVHHGLQPAAHDFASHCEALCARWQVPLQVCRVQAGPAAGDSPEDAARRARYSALAQAATQSRASCVWLGQHADDQAETLLLALSRGAGLPGLASMPARFERGGMRFARPLLAVPAADLRAWLQAQGIPWVEDPTNADTTYTRNRIRHQLLPALHAAFPHFRDTFARSARHAAQAQALLIDLARDDLAAISDERTVVLARLQALSPQRQANVLRHWLRAVHGQSASTAQLDELIAQVAACQTRGHQIQLRVGLGWVARVGPCLHWQAPPSPAL